MREAASGVSVTPRPDLARRAARRFAPGTVLGASREQTSAANAPTTSGSRCASRSPYRTYSAPVARSGSGPATKNATVPSPRIGGATRRENSGRVRYGTRPVGTQRQRAVGVHLDRVAGGWRPGGDGVGQRPRLVGAVHVASRDGRRPARPDGIRAAGRRDEAREEARRGTAARTSGLGAHGGFVNGARAWRPDGGHWRTRR